MKHTAAIEAAITEAATLHHASILADRLRLLADMAEWMAPRAAVLGLTRYTDPLEFARKLICPTMALTDPAFARLSTSRCLDFGCGCGVLGLSLATIASDSQVHCIDRRTKVVHFVDLAARTLGVANCQASAADLAKPPDRDTSYDLVLVRAFVGGADGVALACRWAAPGGCVALWHRPPAPAVSLPPLATLDTTLPGMQLTVYTVPGDTPSP